jgi:hypothetical protein
LRVRSEGRLEETQHRREVRRHRLDPRAQKRAGVFRIGRERDPGDGPQDRAQREVRLGGAVALAGHRVVEEPRRETRQLLHQPGLADPGLPNDLNELRAPLPRAV